MILNYRPVQCVGAQGHDEIVWAVEVSGARLFSASADKTIRVWDIESRRCEQVQTRAGTIGHRCMPKQWFDALRLALTLQVIVGLGGPRSAGAVLGGGG